MSELQPGDFLQWHDGCAVGILLRAHFADDVKQWSILTHYVFLTEEHVKLITFSEGYLKRQTNVVLRRKY